MMWPLLLLACLLLLLGVGPSVTAAASELVVNDELRSKQEGSLPAGWQGFEPEWKGARCRIETTAAGVRFSGGGEPYAVGGLRQRVGHVTGGQAYRVRAECDVDRIASPYRSLLLRVYFFQGECCLHPAGMLARGPMCEGRRARFDDVLVAPEAADSAEIVFEVKWPGEGAVTLRRVSMTPAPRPRPRKARLGAAYLVPRDSTPKKNLELWCEQVVAAGGLHLDILCLGEAILAPGTGESIVECAETIPGPSTERLGRAAAAASAYVVAGLMERDGDRVYNTAVLLDRQGRLAGKYRKVHLPREEWRKGVTPGSEFPVFDADFGKVGIQICYDWFFPEPTALLAARGAEVILSPTWGNTRPDHDGMIDGESTFRVRARDNAVYMVPSVYSGRSMVIDPTGRILAAVDQQGAIAWAEVDLNHRHVREFTGYWRSIGSRHRMPEVYGGLIAPPSGPFH